MDGTLLVITMLLSTGPGISNGLDDSNHFKTTLESPAIEVARAKVVEGGVAGYYDRVRETVVPILNQDKDCDGYFISPMIESPQDQLLLINWKSVDVKYPLLL
jgi:hypothetical protein